MKKVLSVILFSIFCGFSMVSLAQENLKSSKILYDKGLDEIYDVQPISNGYLALGHKGDEATTKKLWLIKFDKTMNVVGSKIIYNQALVSPFRLQPMANGNVLILAQDASQNVQSSILFCLHPEGAISWSKRFAGATNIELSDMLVTADQAIYLYGAQRHILNTIPNNDKALLIKLDKNANQLWQKEIAMGDVELRTKQIMLDKSNQLILTGTMTSVEAQNREQVANSNSYEPSIFTPKRNNVMIAPIMDTAYREDPITGNLSMVIFKKKPKSDWEMKREVMNKLNDDETSPVLATLKFNNETGIHDMHLIPKLQDLKAMMNDTAYVEDPLSGKLSMVITEKMELSTEEKMHAIIENLNARQYVNNKEELQHGDKKVRIARVRSTKNQAVKDTVFIENPLNGQLEMMITDRNIEEKKLVHTKLEGDRQKTNGNINFYVIKVSAAGEVLHQKAVNRYADYSLSNAVVENEKGYLFLLQSANYFGDGMLLQTDNKLQTISEQNIVGTPILFSGLFKQQNKYIIGGIFSNTLKDYSPGVVLLDKNLRVQKAKSSESLFTNFFISNIATLENNSFMLSGIGYENNQPSDVYFLPFTDEGKSACNLTNYNLKMEKVIDVKPFVFASPLTSSSSTSASITDAQFALADESKFTAANICATPDDHPVANNQNGSWNQWNKKNADAFTMKIPADWLQVSPNPSSGDFTIQYDGMQNEVGLKVIVTDINGRIILNQFIQNQDIFTVNLTKYPSGMYNLKIDDGVKSLTKKIEVLK